MPTGLGDEKLWLCPTLDNATPFNDLSTQGNNGTANGGLSTIADTGAGGAYSYDFDGQNDYIDLNDPWNFAGNYSYSLWINKDSGASVQVIGNRDTNADGWLTYINASSVLFAYNDTTTTSNGTISNSTWYCITVVYDGTNLSIYKNGVLDSSVAASQQTASTRNAEIGRYTNGAAYDGQIDDIRFYDRALTQSEISWLATERGVLGTPPAGLGGEQLWISATNDNTGTSTAFNDLSGNSNNGTSSGATVIADTSNGGTYCMDFNGSSDVVTPYKDQTVTSTGVFSMALWVKYDSVASTRGLMAGNIQTNNTGLQVIFDAFDATRGHTGALNPNITGQYSGLCNAGDRNSTSTGTWYHVAYTGDGTTARLYVNGTEVVSQSFGSFSTATWRNPLTLGCFYTGVGTKGGFLDGQIDDARMFGRTITQAEVTHLASQRGVLGSPNATTQYNAFSTHAFRQLFQTRLR